MFKIIIFISLSVFSFLPWNAFALTCKSVNGVRTLVAPLIGNNMYLGGDAPLGRQIFTQQTNRSGLAEIECTDTSQIGKQRLTYILTYEGDKTTAHRPTNLNGIAYETYATIAENGTTSMSQYPKSVYYSEVDCGPQTHCKIKPSIATDILFLFAQVSKVSGEILGSSISPTILQVKIGNSEPVTVVRTTYSGSIKISSNTCKTPDVNVPLGGYSVNEFTKIGSVSPWVKFQISLSDCPAFYGSYPPVNGPTHSWSQEGGAVVGKPTENSLELMLSPLNGVETVGDSVIKINQNARSAKGIGIQVAHDITNSSDSPKVDFYTFKDAGIKLSSKPGDTYLMKFKARYYQTENNVSAGKANGGMTFTINYK